MEARDYSLYFTKKPEGGKNRFLAFYNRHVKVRWRPGMKREADAYEKKRNQKSNQRSLSGVVGAIILV